MCSRYYGWNRCQRCLFLKISFQRWHVFLFSGVWATRVIPKGRRFGPFVGEKKKRSQVTSNVYMWEVCCSISSFADQILTFTRETNTVRRCAAARNSYMKNQNTHLFNVLQEKIHFFYCILAAIVNAWPLLYFINNIVCLLVSWRFISQPGAGCVLMPQIRWRETGFDTWTGHAPVKSRIFSLWRLTGLFTTKF